jgi:hypothetical protein
VILSDIRNHLVYRIQYIPEYRTIECKGHARREWRNFKLDFSNRAAFDPTVKLPNCDCSAFSSAAHLSSFHRSEFAVSTVFHVLNLRVSVRCTGFQHANVIEMDRRGLYRYTTSRQRYIMMQLRNDSDVLRFGKIYVPVGALGRSLRAQNSVKLVEK